MAIAREETPGFASKSLGNDHLLTFDQLDLSFQGGPEKNQNVGTPCNTLGQNPTFYHEIPLILLFLQCEFCEN